MKRQLQNNFVIRETKISEEDRNLIEMYDHEAFSRRAVLDFIKNSNIKVNEELANLYKLEYYDFSIEAQNALSKCFIKYVNNPNALSFPQINFKEQKLIWKERVINNK